VEGTPADCAKLAVRALLKKRPDILISGVNHGSNMGEDVLYSGTVAAAMEGTILGIPAIAISYSSRAADRIPGYASVLERIIGSLMARTDFPGETFFNINLPDVPADEMKGVRVTTLGRRVYSDSLTRREDPAGREYYWIGGGISSWSGRGDSDFRAVQAGYVSITPLHLDLTNYDLISEVRSWTLHG
jgi:5'-nucleotidase